jgi:hypothetical protein
MILGEGERGRKREGEREREKDREKEREKEKERGRENTQPRFELEASLCSLQQKTNLKKGPTRTDFSLSFFLLLCKEKRSSSLTCQQKYAAVVVCRTMPKMCEGHVSSTPTTNGLLTTKTARSLSAYL